MDLSTLQALGSNPAVLAGVIFGLLSTLKRNVSTRCQSFTPPRKEPPAWAWWGLATLLGLLGAAALHASGFGAMLPLFDATGWAAVAWFGLASGLTAVLGRDAFKTALGWIGSGAPGVSVQVPAVAVSAAPVAAPVGEVLTPITPEQAATMTRLDWPAVAGLNDPPEIAPQRE